MAAVLGDEAKQLLLKRYDDIEWRDDVSHLRCVRCQRVAIYHYMPNCHHLHCKNCRTICSDGGRWKCEKCQEYIKQLNDQDHVKVGDTLSKTRVCCPNKKYGCQIEDQLINIAIHMKECKDTREAALPMEYKGSNTPDMLYERVGDLRVQFAEIKREWEANWKQVQSKMNDMDCKIDTAVKQLTVGLNGFKSHLDGQRERLNNFEEQIKGCVSEVKMISKLENLREEMEKIKSEQMTLANNVEKYSETIYTVKGSTDTFIQLLDNTNNKLKKKIDKSETKLMDDLKIAQSKISSLDAKWETDHVPKKELQNTICELRSDLDQQNEQLTHMEQQRQDDTQREMERLKLLETTIEEIKLKQINTQSEALLRGEIGKLEQQVTDHMEMKLVKLNEGLDEYQRQMTNMEEHQKDDREWQEKKLKMIESMTLQTKLDFINYQGNMIQPQMLEEFITMYEVNEWIVNDFKWNSSGEKYSEEFLLPDYNLAANVHFTHYETSFIYTNLSILNHKKLRQPMNIKSMPKVVYIIKDQNVTEAKGDIIRTYHCDFNQPLRYDKEIEENKIHYDFLSSSSSSYIKDNCIKIKTLMEPPSIARTFYSNDGILLWRVDNYMKRLHMEKDRLITYQESPYFYTSPQGYRVQLRLYFVTNDKIAQLRFLTGEHDASLTDKFPHKITITIFNLEDPANKELNRPRDRWPG